MISLKHLNRCIDILSELNAKATSYRDKLLLLEIGGIIKEELDLATENERKGLNAKALLEDNTKLFKDNEALIKDNIALKELIRVTIPKIESKIEKLIKMISVLNGN